ncbi:hypothetical protein G8S49_11445 [Clostridium botulinum C]|uniref:Nal1 N-terminal domain-containing protein n=4 Tax=Clostridium botulinum TaxID=1491 RepID=A0A9N7AL47_CLOBO|nr:MULTISPECIES: hypothetical protein [Clostridium]KMJ93058.1 hypothetical protein CBCST_p3CbCSt0022 [Clostridium botulinum C str. Stockholm]ACT33726.1 conserved hypothetical protein [Clostridium botulinum D str. 1873]AYF55430.1 hypothetical protein DFH04_11945 [Clostridium novyi]MBO3442147.1 hypothetical protein [Clostridium haemolyticum]MCD3195768.1 hypothetical protein [Clostridium botulinum C]
MILSKKNCYNEENKLQENIAHICDCDYKYFLNKKNVVGLGLGYKVKNGFYTNQLCVQVFVSRKFPKNQLNSNDIIPLIYKGIQTDVKETGYFKACFLNKRIRPVLGGYSISTNMNDQISGTAGCVVTNGVSKFVLSTNHVLANLNMLPMKTPIIQPAYIYRGHTPTDTIATLHKFIPLRFIKREEQPTNLTDCALGLLVKTDIMSDNIAFIGKITCVKSPKLGSHVRKVGETSELTQGTITSINATFTVGYITGKVALFKDQIITTHMAQNGDSGSILVDDNNCALGLLFSTSLNNTAFNRLSTVLDQLDAKLINYKD